MPCYTQPAADKDAFDCPYCGAYAHQRWNSVALKATSIIQPPPAIYDRPRILSVPLAGPDEATSGLDDSLGPSMVSLPATRVHGETISGLDVSRCQRCGDLCIWIAGKLAYPDRGLAPAPNTDLPPDIKRDYDEAGAILDRSPRGATALLRLCIQKLCVHLGEKGNNLNTDIGALVKKGLSVRVQRALDIVRVIGNDAVHPGTLDMKDDPQTAATLFSLVNVIANDMITQPKEIDELYKTLPETNRQAIANRDQNQVTD